MAARAGFQSVTPSGGGGGAAAGAGALGPGTPGGPVRMGPAPGQGLYRSPLPGAAYPVRRGRGRRGRADRRGGAGREGTGTGTVPPGGYGTRFLLSAAPRDVTG